MAKGKVEKDDGKNVADPAVENKGEDQAKDNSPKLVTFYLDKPVVVTNKTKLCGPYLAEPDVIALKRRELASEYLMPKNTAKEDREKVIDGLVEQIIVDYSRPQILK